MLLSGEIRGADAAVWRRAGDPSEQATMVPCPPVGDNTQLGSSELGA
jgi:hypothetical protein